MKSHTKIKNSKYELRHEMKNLNYLLVRYSRLLLVYHQKTRDSY